MRAPEPVRVDAHGLYAYGLDARSLDARGQGARSLDSGGPALGSLRPALPVAAASLAHPLTPSHPVAMMPTRRSFNSFGTS